jgi:hypothetical protein
MHESPQAPASKVRKPVRAAALIITGVFLAVIAQPLASVAATLITSADIRNGAVRSIDLNDGGVRSVDIDNGTVRSKDVANGSLQPGDFAANSLPYPGRLPSGKTVRGVYSMSGTADAASDYGSSPISFGWMLPAAPTAHFIEEGDAAPADCPGTAEMPAARPGHLCIYEGTMTNLAVRGFQDPITASSGDFVRRYGAEVSGRAAAAGDYWTSGSWAVTAP